MGETVKLGQTAQLVVNCCMAAVNCFTDQAGKKEKEGKERNQTMSKHASFHITVDRQLTLET
ncbi:MAG: hypothetical protein JSW51_03285 [Gemmatimonadota bacterium]|nr:MAG: hypothetical protein JSW51_03285 [Gemmatimonadota bacterium]